MTWEFKINDQGGSGEIELSDIGDSGNTGSGATTIGNANTSKIILMVVITNQEELLNLLLLLALVLLMTQLRSQGLPVLVMQIL